jgi:hypothetical protein
MNFNDAHGVGFVRAGGPAYGSNLERAMNDPQMRGAIRNVSAQDFASGRMGRSTPVSDAVLRSGSMMRGSLPVAHNQGGFDGRAGNYSSGNRGASANGQHFFSSNGMNSAGRTSNFSSGQASARGSYNWQGDGRGNQSGFQGRSAPTQGSASWQRYASPSPYAGGRQSYSSAPRSYYGGNYASRPGGSYSNGARPQLNLNRPVMQQRAPNGGSYNGGGHTYSAPNGGGSHSSGGGGGHSSGGGHGGGHR